MPRTIDTDVVVIGGGAAGAHAALKALKLSGRRLLEAEEAKADCLVTTCPLCHTSLDPYQSAAARTSGAKADLPIIHLPQLLGLGLGLDPKDLKLDGHVVSMTPVLEKIALGA